MTIKTSSINLDGTVSASGGTATGFIDKGNTLNQLNTILDDSAEFSAQVRVEFSIKDPKVQATAPNGYTQARNTIKIFSPLGLDNGAATVNTASLTLGFDPETTDAEKATVLGLVAQLCTDPDFEDFWYKQSIA